ncbi:MAG: bifunctional hydroxymethylpyrimidine kinase/phosphomethylpyrimidine kinase, partial [Polyangiaceae bacterium]
AADLRAFAIAGVFGCAAAAALTVQSTSGLKSVRAVSPDLVFQQAREVIHHQDVRSIKIGALGNGANVRKIAELLGIHREIPVILDPVMIPTRGGARLLARGALGSMRRDLIPRAALVTANAPEAEALTSMRVLDIESAKIAALAIVKLGARAALVKGGHLGLTAQHAVDVLAIDGQTILLRAPRLKLPALHGGGCTLAALVAGRMAHDPRKFTRDSRSVIVDAVHWARLTHHKMLKTKLRDVGGVLRVLA